ncbi:hypothetical protein pipiens_019128 [Culex pipiens pipiens]|uniref:Secreted protein n=1 Tax=Culex pipiens pipiens TaxID=38569 RepID=A0ABD1DW43_CULPP
MIIRCVKILLAVVLSLTFTVSLAKLVLCVWTEVFIENSADYEIVHGYPGRSRSHRNGGGGSLVDDWLDQNQLGKYRQLFRDQAQLKQEQISLS